MATRKQSGDNKGEVASAPAKPYVVLARKYRPQSFDDLIGQEAMVRTLRNAFASGRIAQGYMLTGVRGVGKTTTARILARALNYATDTVDTPTIDMPDLGRHCAEIMESRHPDVVEMDAASNTGVDNVREIIESARYKPILARYKVFIIDEVHMLSKGAFNALLKTLEEPPEHVKFIFATTEIRKVPVTVLSRCQRFDLRRVDVPALSAHFKRIVGKERAEAEDEALSLIARAAQGSVRDGLSILDQAIAYATEKVTAAGVRGMLGLADRGRIFDLLDALFAGEAGKALEALGALHHDGGDPVQILADLAEAVHATSRAKVVGEKGSREELSAEERRRAGSLAGRLSVALLSRAWQMLLKGQEEAARAPDPLAAAEMVLIRIAYTADLPSPDEIIRTLGGGEAVSARRPQGSAPAPSAGPLNVAPPGQPAASQPVTTGAATQGEADEGPPLPPVESYDGEQSLGPDDLFAEADLDDAGDPGDAIGPTAAGQGPLMSPRSFHEVVGLVGARRDARLKVHLEEHVSLVKFDATSHSIDLHLLAGAPPEIANELREKLNKWTQERWFVMLSKTMGERPLGEARREREAAEIEQLKKHPAVAAVLAEFPDAKIAEVRRFAVRPVDETGTG
jgi:DNA polymerase-3 subunit gamma/tau